MAPLPDFVESHADMVLCISVVGAKKHSLLWQVTPASHTSRDVHKTPSLSLSLSLDIHKLTRVALLSCSKHPNMTTLPS